MSCSEREPTQLIAGYSTEWKRTVPGFPSASFTLKYALRKADGSGQATVITAAADGIETYRVTIAPQHTAAKQGLYQLIGYITDDATAGATVNQVVYRGTIEFAPDPIGDDPSDRRTFYRKMVDQLRAALLKLSSGTVTNVNVNGKSFNLRSLAELRQELARFEQLLRAEEQAQFINEGCGNPNRIFIRFNRVQ